jgi:glutathione S-transferase
MQLYFSPLACSLSARVALYEAHALDPAVEPVEFVQVDTQAQRTAGGADYRTIHGLGLVPALRLEDGELLTENAAILQFVAERYPRAGLIPGSAPGRARARQWLSFVGTELHAATYAPLLDPLAPEGARRHAIAHGERMLAWLAGQLGEREFLLESFSVADAYLSTVLNWSKVTPLQLERWPALLGYLKRIQARPAVARALAEETALYRSTQSQRPPKPLGVRELIERYNAVFHDHDPSALETLVAPDCVIENSYPAPDGSRHVGRAECVALWTSIATAPDLAFEVERSDYFDDRATLLWRLHRPGAKPLRGVNLMRVQGGQIVEALGYVKGG